MYAVVYIPGFSLQAVLRLQPEVCARPVALVDPALSKPLLVEVNAAARAQRVHPGLTPSQAAARCPEIILRARSLPAEAAATEILLQTACAVSASIESTGPGVCTLDLKGLGLEAAWARQQWAGRIPASFAHFHLDARIGVAPTPALALLAARAAEPVLVIEHPDQFMARLPLAALDPAPALADLLRRWGIQTAGQFFALGRDKVAERLGAEALKLFDHAAVENIRPLRVVAPPEQFVEQVEFEQEIETVEPLLFILQRFVEQLSRRLETLYLVVAGLQLQLTLASGEKYERTIGIPSPTGRVETLFRTLRTHLETVRTTSPILALRLSAQPARAESLQFGLFEATVRNPNQFAETLARLGALCGAENVGSPVLEPTHRPDAFRMERPDFTARQDAPPAGRQGPALRRFRPAVGARVEFAREQPASLRSPVFNGAIARVQGPFLASGDWWEKHHWSREEWDVETSNGVIFRIYRSSQGCFVEGVYD